MELAVVSDGWGMEGLAAFHSDPFRVCTRVCARVCPCARVHQICEFLRLDLAVPCAFLSGSDPVSPKSPTPRFLFFPQVPADAVAMLHSLSKLAPSIFPLFPESFLFINSGHFINVE